MRNGFYALLLILVGCAGLEREREVQPGEGAEIWTYPVIAIDITGEESLVFASKSPNDKVKQPAEDAQYYLWPRLKGVEKDPKYPDADEFDGSDPRDSNPIFYGEEGVTKVRSDVTFVSHNQRNHGKGKHAGKVAPVGGQANEAERTRGKLLADMLKALGPDIVALQEIEGKQSISRKKQKVKTFKRKKDSGNKMMTVETTIKRKINQDLIMAQLRSSMAPLQIVWGTDQRTRVKDNGGHEYAPIFYNPETLTCRRGGVKDMTKKPFKERGVSWARCEVVDREGNLPDRREFDFVYASLHAPPPRGDNTTVAEQEQLRKNYMDQLWPIIQYLKRHDPDIIIAGDFNLNFGINSYPGAGQAEKDRIERITESLRKSRRKMVLDKEFRNIKDSNNNPIGTNITDPPHVYDDIIFKEKTDEDFKYKYIAVGFDRLFTDSGGQKDVAMQRKYSDHKPIVAVFSAANDKSDSARSSN